MTDNEIKNMPKLYGGKLSPDFNSNDFYSKKGYVTFQDLLNYANLYQVNVFTSLNIFSSVMLESLNNIPKTTIDYIKNVSSDIQQQFNYLTNLLTGYNYDGNLTMITNDVYLKSMNTPNNIAVAGKSILQTVNCQNINTFDIESKSLSTETINVKSLTVNNIPYQDTGVILCCNVKIESFGQYTVSILQVPLNYSVLASEISISPNNSFSATIIIKPNYTISFYDNSNNVLHSFTNTTTKIIYFQQINFNGILYKINIYYNFILIT